MSQVDLRQVDAQVDASDATLTAMDPEPLPPGTLLSDRFEVSGVLGRGGFGIVYRAKDRRLGDEVALKELAPAGVQRRGGVLDLGSSAEQLRHSFLEEARLTARLNLPGVIPVRAWFSEGGTAYFATPYLANSRTLEDILRKDGPLPAAGALDLFFALMETVEAIHGQGLLHRDIKPSNVLVPAIGMPRLIDFGAARAWHADALVTHTVMFTPGYAPPEQLTDKARRGPATDIYGLCATLYACIRGEPPTPAPARISGEPLVPVGLGRPDVEPAVVAAIQAGLALNFAERPQSIGELRALLSTAGIDDEDRLSAIDARAARLASFEFDRRACPSCGGLLDAARPLRRGLCPVCRRGRIRLRDLHDRLCPVCKSGALRALRNEDPLAICPNCAKGVLTVQRAGLWSKRRTLECPDCSASFEGEGALLTRAKPEPREAHTSGEWREISGRSSSVLLCDTCRAQFDSLPDGRRRQMLPPPKGPHQVLYPEEWARVAAGLDPGDGNGECDSCGAEYCVDGDAVTLLGADADPFGFCAEHQGRRLDFERLRWLGVGKTSPAPGLACDSCATEFDDDPPYLRLVHTPNRLLQQFTGSPDTMENWHRKAQGLPPVGEEGELMESLDVEMRTAYRSGRIGIDASGDAIWKGPATRQPDGVAGTLSVNCSEIAHGGLLKRWRMPLDAIRKIELDDDVLWISMAGEHDATGFVATPLNLTASLASGPRSIEISIEDLAERIYFEIHER